jgi:hypothetical protein
VPLLSGLALLRLVAQELIEALEVGRVGSSEFPQPFDGHLELFGEGYFPNQLIVFIQSCEASDRFQICKGLLLKIRSLLVRLLLIVFFEEAMLEYELFDVISSIKSLIILLD